MTSELLAPGAAAHQLQFEQRRTARGERTEIGALARLPPCLWIHITNLISFPTKRSSIPRLHQHASFHAKDTPYSWCLQTLGKAKILLLP